MANRLASSTSPYLRQHADNPVDWWPWCDEALAEAARRDVPILLSVGYAACHWCHVMAHEVFEDEQVAENLKDGFVAVKVDREERPDIDAVYMAATVALTGRGGWPMTCLLTPDGRPFFAATYIPRPQFLHLLTSAREAWAERRGEVEESADRIAEVLRHQATVQSGLAPLAAGEDDGAAAMHRALDAAEEQAASTFDWERGGFGTAPKFPPSMTLAWLLRHHDRTGTPRALQMVDATCEAMARGGMYDQLAGGFARYSTDADWVVPHFEKMLYDNALLLSLYTDWARATGSPLGRRIASETADFLLADLRTAQGAFASALDADTTVESDAGPVGVEGATYVWTPRELVEVLGDEDGVTAALLLQVSEQGTFEHGASVLQRRIDPDEAWWTSVRARLRAARDRRPQPARDDKVVTAWNGLAIAALADAGVLLDEPRYVDAATRCAEFLLETHLVDGRLRRTSRDGVVGDALAVAEDHGDLAFGLVRLHLATGEASWLEMAEAVLDVALPLFRADDGGFHDTGSDAEPLLLRPRSDTDNAEPCGASSLARALLEYGAVAGSPSHLDTARDALDVICRIALRTPTFGGWSLAAAECALDGPVTVAVVHGNGDAGPTTASDAARALLEVARRHPRALVVHGPPGSTPLLDDRPLREGRPTAYFCRDTVCGPPVTDPDELHAALAARPTPGLGGPG